MKKIIAYKCDHCPKVSSSAGAMANHEPVCKKNPANQRACFGCIFAENRTYPIEFENPDRTFTTDCKVIFCKKLNQGVYPPSVERKQNWFDEFGDGEFDNVPMPKVCKHKKSHEIQDEPNF